MAPKTKRRKSLCRFIWSLIGGVIGGAKVYVMFTWGLSGFTWGLEGVYMWPGNGAGVDSEGRKMAMEVRRMEMETGVPAPWPERMIRAHQRHG